MVNTLLMINITSIHVLVLYQISDSPQVKQCPMITYKHDLCELPHELPKDLRS